MTTTSAAPFCKVTMELTAENLRVRLHYDETSGVFVRAPGADPRVRKCAVGYLRHDGYIDIEVQGRSYRAHRLAWLYVYGVWPDRDKDIDHINGKRADNRIANLRCLSRSANLQNMRGPKSTNRSGLLGAHYDKSKNRWRSSIHVNGKAHRLGRFPAAQAAHEAYLKAKRELHPASTL